MVGESRPGLTTIFLSLLSEATLHTPSLRPQLKLPLCHLGKGTFAPFAPSVGPTGKL